MLTDAEPNICRFLLSIYQKQSIISLSRNDRATPSLLTGLTKVKSKRTPSLHKTISHAEHQESFLVLIYIRLAFGFVCG